MFRLSYPMFTPTLADSDDSEGNSTSSSEDEEITSSTATVQSFEANVTEIDERDNIHSVAFLADGRGILAGGTGEVIRWWRVEDMEEAGSPFDVKNEVMDIAVPQEGKWIVSGARGGDVTVWSAQSREEVARWKAHTSRVTAVDVTSPSDSSATKIVSASWDRTARVWSLTTGEELLQLDHDGYVTAVRFSRDGRLFATATSQRKSLRIYQTEQGRLITDFEIVTSGYNRSIAWTHAGNNHLFAASKDGYIYHLHPFTGSTLSKWCLYPDLSPWCIALASNDSYIAVSTALSVSFWDATTHEQIGFPIEGTRQVTTMAISPNHDVVTGGGSGNKIVLQNLHENLPSRYTDSLTTPKQNILPMRSKNDESGELQACHEAQSCELESPRAKIISLENTIQELRSELPKSQDNVDSLIRAHEQMHQCETLYAQDRINDAARLLLEILSSTNSTIKADDVIMGWLPEFAYKCVTVLEEEGDEAARLNHDDEALLAYRTALSLGFPTPKSLLSKWAKSVLRHGSAGEAMVDVAAFKLSTFDTHQVICDVLEKNGRIVEAIECLRQMQQKLSEDVSHRDDLVHRQWTIDFQRRCRDQLEKLSDAAMESHRYHEATKHFSAILSLDPVDRVEILIKRNKSRLSTGSWEDALCDADEVIRLDSSSHQGYERRHAALQAGKHHTEAVEAFHVMLARLEESPHAHIRNLRRQYIDVTPEIQKAIEKTVSGMPRVLIDTATGRLRDKTQQMMAFKKLPIYDELRSSMTTSHLHDQTRILREVEQFYRYVMLSHRWENCGEPSYQTVQDIPVYKLQMSSPNSKLQTFCKVSCALGFHWVWSDTCCIDRKDSTVLNESLVAMFTWYRGSALTLVYLHDVSSQLPKPDALRESEWNERGWTYQEYVAAETVQFYTKEWQPYLGLDTFNHKESPIIVAEMEQASQVPPEALAALQPGLNRVREKLFLASRRQTTLVEDTAYSLLGIFNANIFIRYGEGRCTAVGRLLEHILTGSGDVTILAWTGPAGDYNSCLPPDIVVYDCLDPPHILHPIETTDMNDIVNSLRSSLSQSDLSSVARLFHQLNKLPLPSLHSRRLKLSGLAFPVTRLDEMAVENDACVHRATTSTLGDVLIKTKENLAGMKHLPMLLFHPWICTLLDQDFSGSDTGSLGLDDTTRALRLVARLWQPFGALLLIQVSRMQYRRVATDSLIMARIREDTPLDDLMRGITTVDVQ